MEEISRDGGKGRGKEGKEVDKAWREKSRVIIVS